MQANTKAMSYGMAEPAALAPADGTVRLQRLAALAEELARIGLPTKLATLLLAFRKAASTSPALASSSEASQR
jgi:hypothetical protein